LCFLFGLLLINLGYYWLMGFNEPCVFLVLISLFRPIVFLVCLLWYFQLSPLWFPVVCLPCDIFGVDLLLINDLPRKNGINKCKITTEDRLCPRLIRRRFLTIINFTVEATSLLETIFWAKSSDFGDFICLTTSLRMLLLIHVKMGIAIYGEVTSRYSEYVNVSNNGWSLDPLKK